MEKKLGKKILFILKKRSVYSNEKYVTVNSGLYNSAKFVNNMLVKHGVDSHLVEVNDNNDIDAVVTKFKPDTVIVEAIWVIPSKFEILQKLHPNVTWVIRVHSELPFIANEGIAIKWLKDYGKYENVVISSNSKDFICSMRPILESTIFYLPNYYPTESFSNSKRIYDGVLDFGLFGAIRPMKNSLFQAVAAIVYANKVNKKLRLHINVARIEQNGENALKNIKALFEGTIHELVEHKWYSHEEFIKVVRTMDLGLQVSLSETYNIVTADFVSQGVPVVTSEEIKFVNYFNRLKTNKNAIEMSKTISTSLNCAPILTFFNKILLKLNSFRSEWIWLRNSLIH